MRFFKIRIAVVLTSPVWNTRRHLLSIHFNVRIVVFLFYFTLLLRQLLQKKLHMRDNCTVYNSFRSKEEGVQHYSIHRRTCTLRTCFWQWVRKSPDQSYSSDKHWNYVEGTPRLGVGSSVNKTPCLCTTVHNTRVLTNQWVSSYVRD
jgi:hypothetical protein